MIVPTVLVKTEKKLKEQLRIASSFLDNVHLDIMDGRFVPNKTFPLNALLNLRTRLRVSVHLMAFRPETYFGLFRKAGIRRVIFHVEATKNPEAVIAEARKHGLEVGIAFNPRTRVERVVPFAKLVDEILVMSVQPGFGGQKFRPSALKKVRRLSRLKVAVGVDGGVHLGNCQEIVAAGADILYVGSGVWGKHNVKKAYGELDFLCGM